VEFSKNCVVNFHNEGVVTRDRWIGTRVTSRMSLLNNRSKCSPSHFSSRNLNKTLSVEKNRPHLGYFHDFLKKLTKVDNHPTGQNSPNLVTLIGTRPC
jgi:hypothetical protein